jgi:hypothetical protein
MTSGELLKYRNGLRIPMKLPQPSVAGIWSDIAIGGTRRRALQEICGAHSAFLLTKSRKLISNSPGIGPRKSNFKEVKRYREARQVC